MFVTIILCGYLAVCCNHKGNGQKSTNTQSLPSSDSVYTVNASSNSFRQTVGQMNFKESKFVRITVTEIINPTEAPITFDLYYLNDGKSEFLGSVAPFPASNPGSYIIATAGKVKASGELELRLKLPENWNRNERLEVKFRALRFE